MLYYKVQFPTEMSKEMQKARTIAYPISSAEGMVIPEIKENILIHSKDQYMFVTESNLQANCKSLKSFEVQNLQLCNSVQFKNPNAKEKGSIKIPRASNVNIGNLDSFRKCVSFLC